MASDELKNKIEEWFKAKSTGDKKKFYMADVVKAMTELEFPKRDVQKAVNELTTEDRLMYWSSGSTTMLVLPENFPKE